MAYVSGVGAPRSRSEFQSSGCREWALPRSQTDDVRRVHGVRDHERSAKWALPFSSITAHGSSPTSHAS